MKATTFLGPNGLRNFLNPASSFMLPLVELPSGVLNPFYDRGVRITGVLGSMQPPHHNIKCAMVATMLMRAVSRGIVKPGDTIITASSGNTGAALVTLAPIIAGVKDVLCVLPADIASSKRDFIRLLGGTDILYGGNTIAYAQSLAEKKGYVNIDQYVSSDNPYFYEHIFAPYVRKALKGKINLFVAAMGTGGTVTGVANYFRQLKNSPLVVGASVVEGQGVPGVRTRSRLLLVKQPWERSISHFIEVSAQDAYRTSLELLRNGYPAGPRGGLALKAAFKHVAELIGDMEFPQMYSGDGLYHVVVLFPDSPSLYLDKYPTWLPAEDILDEVCTAGEGI